MQRRPQSRHRMIAKVVIVAMVGGVVALSTNSASAATATVGDGLTTTDLNAVGMTPSSLASALVGNGVTVSNVTYSGSNAQAGTIHVVDPAVVSFNDGIILSSGNIADIVGPNKSDGTTGDMAGPDDADLNALIADTQTVNPVTFDRASLEFDFVPTANHVYFTYTFGSDEYLEWVNLFNDVFAFYVNGQNCAIVPGGAPVTIDTINSSVNANLFRDNAFSSPPANPINIESDGLSVEMICSAAVNAGQVNHMKLAIADTSDQILDSVVMIKADSFGTVKPESCNDGVDNNDDTLIDDGDPICQGTTTPPPAGSSGIGSSGNPPAFTGNEGTPIGLDVEALGWSLSSDTLNTTWTVTGINGTTGTCEISPAGPQAVVGGSVAPVSAVCPNEGEYVAHVFGWDVEGKGSDDKDVDFFVHNAPPAVAIDAPSSSEQFADGAAVGLSATVTDPGANDSLTCEINWGDGATESGALADGACTGSHTYTAAGTQVLSVTATDDAGDSAADAVVVEVIAETTIAPVVTSDPADQTVTAGETATFTASASGQPAPSVQWQVSTDGGATFSDLAGQDSGTLGVVAAAGDDGRRYRAVFTNAVGSVSTSAATLTVNVAPVVTTQPVNRTVSVGQMASFTASASGQPAPSVQWQVSTDGGATFSDLAGQDSGTLGVVAALADNGRQYRAVFTNAVGSVSTTPATLTVTVPSTLTATKTKLTSSGSPSGLGVPVVFIAQVTSLVSGRGTPTGKVVFKVDGVTQPSAGMLNGYAFLIRWPLSLGSHTITATYTGSSKFAASPTVSLVQKVIRG